MEKKKNIPTLKTGRLVLRPFEIDGAAEVQRLAGDKAVADTTLSVPHPYPDGGAEEWISDHADTFNKGLGVTFAVTGALDGTLVGAISLLNLIVSQKAELGYWTGKPYWNQGFCTEAGQAVLAYAFKRLALARVYACHLKRNPASGRVLQKIGLRQEGSRRQYIKKWDRVEDIVSWSINKQE